MANVDVTRIAGNIGALNALNSLQTINKTLAVHQLRLSTGKRINEAADDPAGLLTATTFDVRRQGMQVALGAIGSAKNVMATAEGGLRKIQDVLVKMRNKALEAETDILGTAEYEAVQTQLRAYRDEIDDIVEATQWNGKHLLSPQADGGSGVTTALTFLADADGTDAIFEFAAIGNVAANQGFHGDSGDAASADGLGLSDTALTVSDATTAADARTSINTALDIVKESLSQVGSFTARLSFKEEALIVAHANVDSAYNRIMNANMAEEQVEASKFLILQQTATAMLAQANMAPQFMLSLFR
jgi:flagellin